MDSNDKAPLADDPFTKEACSDGCGDLMVSKSPAIIFRNLTIFDPFISNDSCITFPHVLLV
jgi:hypothetical protein